MDLSDDIIDDRVESDVAYTLRCERNFRDMSGEQNDPFAIETWHIIQICYHGFRSPSKFA